MTNNQVAFFTDPPDELEPEPAKPHHVEITTLKWDRKREKEHDKAMKLASKAINGAFRLPKAAPLSPADRKELRAEQQRQRRSSRAIGEALL